MSPSPVLSRVLRVPLILLAAALPYLVFLHLPLISDDYLQITLSRDFLSAEGTRDLLSDALYRCRATSLAFTHAIDLVASADPVAHRWGSIVLHALNGCIIVLFGSWPVIGYRRAFAAAVAFLLLPTYHEAVVWIAAVHDLLLFGFAMSSLLCWIHWLWERRSKWLYASLALFLLALASKESAVVLPALILGAWWIERSKVRKDLGVVAVAFAASVGYTLLVFQASDHHLHLHDGTFSLNAPVVANVIRTLFLIWMPWGFLAALYLLWKRRGRELFAALTFSVVVLLPYCFLTHSLAAPSRHRYWASVAVAFLLASAFDALRSSSRRAGPIAAWAGAAVLVLSGPLWLLPEERVQYLNRAAVTEDFLQFARSQQSPVWVGKTPLRAEVYDSAARIALGWKPGEVRSVEDEMPPAGRPVFNYGSSFRIEPLQ
jgi:hypothetical protein